MRKVLLCDKVIILVVNFKLMKWNKNTNITEVTRTECYKNNIGNRTLMRTNFEMQVVGFNGALIFFSDFR